tara:strand:- start:321 stop:764 length:444 start_codon:yes stop_codon:yes gene_type:complete
MSLPPKLSLIDALKCIDEFDNKIFMRICVGNHNNIFANNLSYLDGKYYSAIYCKASYSMNIVTLYDQVKHESNEYWGIILEYDLDSSYSYDEFMELLKSFIIEQIKTQREFISNLGHLNIEISNISFIENEDSSSEEDTLSEKGLIE